MNYEEWNAGLTRHFFNPTHAGRRVYLHTTDEVLKEVSGLDKAEVDFVAAVKRGPAGSWGSFCGKALWARARWQDRSTEPPFVAHLCFLALAAAREGDWVSYAYYPRFWSLIGERGEGTPPDFHSMQDLWRDLERWTHVDLADARGRFKAQAAGKWIHVGIPVAQTTLTDAERRALPQIFEAADLEPGARLPPEEVAGAVAVHGTYSLRHRTLSLLNGSRTSDPRAELVSLLQTELMEWDGATVTGTAAARREGHQAGLRLWLSEIDPAGFVSARLVARMRDGDDFSDRLFTVLGRDTGYVCPAGSGGISGAIYSDRDGVELDAATLPWTNRLEFSCRGSSLKLVFRAAEVRVFADAATESISGFIETRVLPFLGYFFVTARDPHAVRINDWGRAWCSEWAEQNIRGGLPSGWRLFRGKGARGDGGLADRYPIFARPAAPRLRFQGGIRAGDGARYFPFALPRVLVEWHEAPTSITCEGVALVADADGLFTIPPAAIKAVNQVEAHFGDVQVLDYLHVISDGWSWSAANDCLPANGYGLEPRQGDPLIRGALVEGHNAPSFTPGPDSVSSISGRCLWIGRETWQVADLRRKRRPPAWPPVWLIIVKRRRMEIIYCGFDPELEAPSHNADGRPIKKWKAALWSRRRRTATPGNPAVAALLNQYREVARAL